MSAIRIAADEAVLRLVIDSPPANILTRALLRELREAICGLGGHPTARVLVLTAAGRHFSAGADVGEHLPPHFERLIPEFLQTVTTLDRFPLPVVAAVRGRCLGGGFELALAADVIIASETASFGQPEIALGVAPPAAAAWLPSRCPRGVATELLFTGDVMPAPEAQRAGLVRQIVSDDQLDEAVDAFVGRITRHSAAAVREIKQMMRAGRHDSSGAAVTLAGDRYVQSLMKTHDAVEGLHAFVEKRPAAWSHR